MMSGITDTGGDYQEKQSEEIPQEEVVFGEVSYSDLHPISDNAFEGPSGEYQQEISCDKILTAT